MTVGNDVLLCWRGFQVNFFIMLVDMVDPSPGADPVHLCVPGGEGGLCRARSGYHVGAEGVVIRQERLADALGKKRECHDDRGCEQKRRFHDDVNFYFGKLLCQASGWK